MDQVPEAGVKTKAKTKIRSRTAVAKLKKELEKGNQADARNIIFVLASVIAVQTFVIGLSKDRTKFVSEDCFKLFSFFTITAFFTSALVIAMNLVAVAFDERCTSNILALSGRILVVSGLCVQGIFITGSWSFLEKSPKIRSLLLIFGFFTIALPVVLMIVKKKMEKEKPAENLKQQNENVEEKA